MIPSGTLEKVNLPGQKTDSRLPEAGGVGNNRLQKGITELWKIMGGIDDDFLVVVGIQLHAVSSQDLPPEGPVYYLLIIPF